MCLFYLIPYQKKKRKGRMGQTINHHIGYILESKCHEVYCDTKGDKCGGKQPGSEALSQTFSVSLTMTILITGINFITLIWKWRSKEVKWLAQDDRGSESSLSLKSSSDTKTEDSVLRNASQESKEPGRPSQVEGQQVPPHRWEPQAAWQTGVSQTGCNKGCVQDKFRELRWGMWK